jgi:hypothetical protein
MMYEPGFYIPEDGILHSHRRENLKSYDNGDSFTLLFLRIITYEPSAVRWRVRLED